MCMYVYIYIYALWCYDITGIGLIKDLWVIVCIMPAGHKTSGESEHRTPPKYDVMAGKLLRPCIRRVRIFEHSVHIVHFRQVFEER